MVSHKTEVKQADTVQGVALDHWPTFRLGALCDKIGSGATPKGGSQVYVNEGVSLIRSQNVYNGVFKYDGLSHITDEAAYKLRSVTVQQDDVLLNITGDSVARCTVVPAKVLPARVNQHVAIVRVKQGVCSPQFLQAVLTEPKMQAYMIGLASSQGGSRNALTKSNIEEFEIVLPPLPVQRKIASILGAYDDLIENNCRRIALLEKMASELYRERFCRRKYIANKIAIGELIVENAKSKIKAGDCKGGVGNIPFFTSGSSIYWCNDGLVDGVNLYLNTGGSSDVKIHNGEASYSTDTWSISSDKDIVYFLFHYLKSLSDSGELFSSYFKGATIQHLQKRDFRKHVISVPEPNDLASFNALVIPMHLAADNFKKQNQRLCSSRDRLLPRLMSGKIDLDKLVKGAEVENG